MKKSYLIALAMVVLAVVWMLSGVFSDAPETPHHTAGEAKQVQAGEEKAREARANVRVRVFQAQLFSPYTEINGRTIPSRSVALRAEVDGRVTKLLADKGDLLSAGKPVVELDKRDRRERVAEAEEMLKQANVEFEAAQSLQSEGFNSRIRLAEKSTARESARAALKQAKTDLANTVIRAPYDGVMATKDVNVGDYLRAGDQVADFVDLDPVKVSGFLSENDVVDVKLGDMAEVTLSDGQNLSGAITFLAPEANDQTRTFAVEISIPNPDNKIVAGLTAAIKVPRTARAAYRVSPATLTINTAGQVGVKIVDDQGYVRFAPVAILADQSDAVWIGGLPDSIRLITVGQDFIAEGQRVQLKEAPPQGTDG